MENLLGKRTKKPTVFDGGLCWTKAIRSTKSQAHSHRQAVLPPPPALIRGSIDGRIARTYGRSSASTLRVVFGMKKDVFWIKIHHNDLFYTEKDFASS
jgi:hypothetical protein